MGDSCFSNNEQSSWILGSLNLHLEVRESVSLLSGHPNLEINIFHISYAIIYYPFLFHFYISCLDQAGIMETRTQLHGMDFQLQDVTKFMDSRVFESPLGS